MKIKSIFRSVFISILLLATSVHAQEECIQTVVITGYYQKLIIIITSFAGNFVLVPTSGSDPGGTYSANPNGHTNCVADTLANAQQNGSMSTPSQPTNTSLAIPMRYANPIDIVNGSAIGAANGGVNGSAGFMVFPNYAAGTNAAVQSVAGYAQRGYTVAGLIQTWAPPSINPNTYNNVLSALGISNSMANATQLSMLTSAQILQIISAFAWQEGFKPAGC